MISTEAHAGRGGSRVMKSTIDLSTTPSLEAAYACCRQLARSHYENFPVVSLCVPRHLRRHFYSIYAYCRVSDDLGDEGDPSCRSKALEDWERQVRDAFLGSPQGPILLALADTVKNFDIPQQLFFDLLHAFKLDQVKTSYATEQELLEYSRYSAQPVGRIVLQLLGNDTEEALNLSDLICAGLQLSNFCQDVAMDYKKGRVYIPAADMRDCGYSINDLDRRRYNSAFIEVMKKQVARARCFLINGMPLARLLSTRMGVEIKLICMGSLRLLEKIEKNGYRVLENRPVLTRSDFLLICTRLFK